MDKFLSKLVIITLLSCLAFLAAAQRERNYISFVRIAHNPCRVFSTSLLIYGVYQKYLKNDIERQSPNSVIHCAVPEFRIPGYHIHAQRFDWDKVNKQLMIMRKPFLLTNICSVWTRGIQLLDPNKDNYMFLLTDGGNSKQYGDVPAVCNQIRQWCSQTQTAMPLCDADRPGSRPRLKKRPPVNGWK